jgi:hypothetical protein
MARRKSEYREEDGEILSELGVEKEEKEESERTPEEERIIAGFEDIQRFVEKHNRLPLPHEGGDIFERIYATRLKTIRHQEDCINLLSEYDHQGLLNDTFVQEETAEESLSDDELLEALGVSDLNEGDMTDLRYVKSRLEVRAAEDIAQRKPCDDFEKFKSVFDVARKELNNGVRNTKLFRDDALISEGDLFILYGQMAYVAEKGEEFVHGKDKKDARLRVVYDNGTESNLLMRSLQRALNKDELGRRIEEQMPLPLFADKSEEGDFSSGRIYILKSKAENPEIKKYREVLHKIGGTGSDIKRRIANAPNDPTFLMAEVEIVDSYELYNINLTRFEKIIHKFFEPAKLDIQIIDRFGQPVIPKEWFLVPLFIIHEAVERIRNGTIEDYFYDVSKAQIMLRQKKEEA